MWASGKKASSLHLHMKMLRSLPETSWTLDENSKPLAWPCLDPKSDCHGRELCRQQRDEWISRVSFRKLCLRWTHSPCELRDPEVTCTLAEKLSHQSISVTLSTVAINWSCGQYPSVLLTENVCSEPSHSALRDLWCLAKLPCLCRFSSDKGT